MCELVDHVVNGITHNTTGIQCYVGALRLVEWVVDASEVGDFAGTSLRVQALHISVLADFQRCGDVDHDRIVWEAVENLLAHVFVRCDERADNVCVFGYHPSHLGDAKQVSLPSLAAEIVVGEEVPDGVPIQYLATKPLSGSHCNGRLPCA